jgi:DNA primase catalytic core
LSQWDAFKEAVRDAADIVRVVGEDVELRRSGRTLKGCSPFTGEKHPSFHVWPDRESWWDFSGGRNTGGDVFAYVMERHGYSFNEALTFLADKFGVQRPSITEEEGARLLAIEEERRQVQHVHDLAAEYYYKVLPDEIRDRWYRQHYGFTDETIDRFRLGWATGKLWEYITEVRDVPRPTALKSGLFVQLDDGRIVDFFQKRLVFPYWKRGRVCYFTARKTDETPAVAWEESKYKKLLTRSDRHSYVSEHLVNDTFLNEDAARGAELVVITEGTPDCISGAQVGFACISPGTTTFREQDLEKLTALTAKAKRVVICNDSEASGAGEHGAWATAKALWSGGRQVYIATIPRPEGRDNIDLNELAKEQGDDAVRQVVDSARWWPEILLDRVPKEAGPAFEEALDQALAAVRSATPALQDRLLRDLHKRTGTGMRALRARCNDLEPDERPQRQPKPSLDELGEPSKPAIVINNRQESEVLDEARTVFVAANARRIDIAASGGAGLLEPVFRRSKWLVRLGWENQDDDEGVARVRVFEPMNRDTVYSYLVRDADWLRLVERKDGTAMLPASPPSRAPSDIVELPPELPNIHVIVPVPVFGHRGELLAEPGMHAEDGVWLEPEGGVEIPPVSSSPSSDEIARARSLLIDDVFVDFPFCSEADRAHAVALTLLPFMRRLIPGATPLHLVEAPGQGSGKGLIANVGAVLMWGREAMPCTLPSDEEEVRKTLAAKLLAGAPLVFIDNLEEETPLTSVTLATILTGRGLQARRLGETKELHLINRAIWVATGNNPILGRDFVRRTVRIRIDAKVERAWERAGFKHDPLWPWVRAHRGELLWAVYTLVRAWISAGRPRGARSLASFQAWAAVMGGLLEVAHISGFLENHRDNSASDFATESWHEFVLAWMARFSTQAVSVSELATLVENQELLPDMFRGASAATTRGRQTILGRALSGKRGAIIGGWCISPTPKERDGRARYQLSWVGEGGTLPAHATSAQLPAQAQFASVEPF